MWAGLPWPRLDCDVNGGGGGSGGGSGEGEMLARCVESLRSSGLVQEGGVGTSLEVKNINSNSSNKRGAEPVHGHGDALAIVR